MDRIDLLIVIEQTTTFLRVYHDEVLEKIPGQAGVSEDETLKKAVRELISRANVLLLPGGAPCARCNGSGVEP